MSGSRFPKIASADKPSSARRVPRVGTTPHVALCSPRPHAAVKEPSTLTLEANRSWFPSAVIEKFVLHSDENDDFTSVDESRHSRTSTTRPRAQSLKEEASLAVATAVVPQPPQKPKRGDESAAKSREQQELFERLFQDPRKDLRTHYGMTHLRQPTVRPPPPRSAEERRKGREIARRNVQQCTTTARSRSPPSPLRSVSPPTASRGKLNTVAKRVEQNRSLMRTRLDQRQRRLDEFNAEDALRSQCPVRSEDIVELIMRVCTWHVTLSIVQSAQFMHERFQAVRQFRAEQLERNRRSWMILCHSLYPPLRRWVRRVRLRRCFRMMLCVLFIVRLMRVRRHRSAKIVLSLLKLVCHDRTRALKQYSRRVRRAIDLVDRSFRCRFALRLVLNEQWMAMETSLLLYRFGSFPDIPMIPGWKDEHAAVRLKFLSLAPNLPPLLDDGTAEAGRALSASQSRSHHDNDDDDDLGNGSDDDVGPFGTQRRRRRRQQHQKKANGQNVAEIVPIPNYAVRCLKWRNFFRKYRPVGVFEDWGTNRLPRTLSVLRTSSEAREKAIEMHLDAEYRFLRQQVLDAQIATHKRKRNLEEWRDRQKVEAHQRIRAKFPSLNPHSRIFEVSAEFEYEKRTGHATQLLTLRGTNPGNITSRGDGSSADAGWRGGGVRVSGAALFVRARLIEEHTLQEMVTSALQGTIQELLQNPLALIQRRPSMLPSPLSHLRGGGGLGAMMRRKSVMAPTESKGGDDDGGESASELPTPRGGVVIDLPFHGGAHIHA